ncbi:ATP-binding cassette domain-containing protein [Aurantiacibacter suaedae]|uniref:ATP-binding cassette domain-containing protein n=1 Tax=Aurantiacibacter suaedae TaxID=2545755 RepID=UPI0010F43583|nr:ATP-binding cassette domain-containing protein [Aurantiacibacter suaedae]
MDVFTKAPAPDFADSIVWLGKRLATVFEASGGLTYRDARKLRAQFADKEGADANRAAAKSIQLLCQMLNLKASRWRQAPRKCDLPFVALIPGEGYRFVYDLSGEGLWLTEGAEGRERIEAWPQGTVFSALERRQQLPREKTARGVFEDIMAVDKSWIVFASLASTIASVLVLATSLYSMQVYDRVIGQGGVATLIVLTIGAMIAVLIELCLKLARSAIVDRALRRIDIDAARNIFQRMLATRLDQYPRSLGTFAAQVRGYEAVRAFIIARKLYLFTDAPFALFFLGVIFLIGGPAVAAVPLVAFIIALSVGLGFRRAIEAHSSREDMVGNQRHGLLVEAIQGAEFLKATGGSWQARQRWDYLSRCTAEEMTQIKHLNETASYASGVIQQISYIGLVATGAYLAVTSNSLTVGSIIACSIVSGRVLMPVNAIPGLLVQWAHAKVALRNLDRLYELAEENDGVDSPLVPEVIRSRFEVANLEFSWVTQPTPLEVKSLEIGEGERVAILGAVGCGKSTLLKLMAGLIKPERGHVLLDGLDVQHISAERRSELIGYLPQQIRLVSGTLRENLTMGLPYVDDEALADAIRASGLASLLAGRSEGVQMPISEGGEGLSGGQRQIVGLTRMLLAKPRVWLLDEPTSAMDDATEEQCLRAVRDAVAPTDTLVLVTHKIRLLSLVDRVIVLTPQGIALDGPRDAVLERLRQGASAAQQSAQGNPTGQNRPAAPTGNARPVETVS